MSDIPLYYAQAVNIKRYMSLFKSKIIYFILKQLKYPDILSKVLALRNLYNEFSKSIKLLLLFRAIHISCES